MIIYVLFPGKRHWAESRRLDFGHFPLGGGSGDEVFPLQRQVKWLQQGWLFDHFLAEERDQIETGRAGGFPAPFGEWGKGLAAAGTKCQDACQQKRTVGSYDESRLPRDRLRGTQLGLSYSDGVFFLAVIDLDLPAVEIGL